VGTESDDALSRDRALLSSTKGKMSSRVKHILDILEGVAPARLAEAWDNPGLQVGGREAPVSRLLISLDPTLDAVREATRRGAQLLITHHPLIFKPISSIEPTRYPGDVLHEAIRNGIALACAHTNLDAARGGVNDLLAGLLDLRDLSVLEGPGEPAGEEGIGRIGALPRPLALEAFAREVKGALDAPVVGVVGSGGRTVRRGAVVGGSGGGLIEAAARKGADVLVTGDVGHHDALSALAFGIAVVDAGHFHTEKAAMTGFRETMESRLREAGHGAVAVELYHEEAAPMRYE
jgi:dinuclear metal center YbgI/SA1388 family protein